MIALICLIAAAVCFLLTAFGVATGRVSTIGLGLFLWIVGEKFTGGLP